jgi:muconolactone delta-isomerase
MITLGDGDRRSERQRETPSDVNTDGVVALKGRESERCVLVGRRGVWIGMNEVVAGHVVVEAIDLVAVMSREEIEDLVQEVLDFDDGFVRERWRIEGNVDGA